MGNSLNNFVLNTINSLSFDGIFFLNNGNVVEANLQFAKMLGYKSIEQIIGVNFCKTHLAGADLGRINMYASNNVSAFADDLITYAGEIIHVKVKTKEIPQKGWLVIVKNVTGEIKTSRHLAQSKESFFKLFELDNIILTLTSINEGVFLEVNSGFLKTFGFEKQEVIGKKSQELLKWDESSLSRKQLVDSLLNNEGVGNVEVLFYHKAGSPVYTSLNIQEVQLHGESFLLTIAVDITQHLHNEICLEKANERLKLHMKQTALGVIEWDENLNVLGWNKAAEEIFGYSEQEIKGKNASIIVPDFEVDRINELKSELFNNEGDGHIINANITKEGKIIQCEWYNTPLINKNNKVVGIAAFVRDITKRFELENEVKKLNVAIEQSAASIVITNSNGEIEYVNNKFVEITGYSKDEVLGKNPRILKSGKQSNDFYKKLWLTITSGKTWKGEFENKNKTGTYFWESATISPVYNRKNEIINYIGVKEDITFRKKAGQLLINAIVETEQKERKRFAKDLHDDIGAHLSNISLHLKLLEGDLCSNNEKKSIVRETIDLMNDTIVKTKEIANNINPANIIKDGVTNVIEQHCKKVNNLNMVCISYKNEIESNQLFNMNRNLHVVIYRVYNELFNNTIKYAKAKNIAVCTHIIKHNFYFEYTDDGVGYDATEELLLKKGNGLDNIINRVNMLSGNYMNLSRKGKGCKVVVKINLLTNTMEKPNLNDIVNDLK